MYSCFQIMDTEKFNTTDSIRTIEEAINEVKTTKSDASFYYILWGSILLIYFLLHYYINKMPDLKSTYLNSFSWLLFPLGGLLSFFNKSKETENYVPLFERVYFWSFTAFACLYGVLTFASTYFSSSLSIMLFPLIIGSIVYIVGGITKHTPSIIGGVIGIVFSLFSIMSTTEIQYLIASLTCLSTCIIPGITMRKSNV